MRGKSRSIVTALHRLRLQFYSPPPPPETRFAAEFSYAVAFLRFPLSAQIGRVPVVQANHVFPDIEDLRSECGTRRAPTRCQDLN